MERSFKARYFQSYHFCVFVLYASLVSEKNRLGTFVRVRPRGINRACCLAWALNGKSFAQIVYLVLGIRLLRRGI